MAQTIEVRSNDVAHVSEVSRQATELINQGIMLESASSEGNNDTSSLDKDVIAVVTSSFQLE